MITLKELLDGSDASQLPDEHLANLQVLLERINKIRAAWGQPMKVTSGYRSKDRHLAIYAKKGITDPTKIPMGSKHLSGQAVDIYDPKQKLQSWLIANAAILKNVGLWCEHFSATPNWVHFQCVAPKSGTLFFYP